MAAVLRGIGGLPFNALRLTLRLLRRIQRGPTPRHLLPVAGLDHERAAPVLFALREAASEAEEDEAVVVEQWLAAAQLAQVGMDRLVATLELIEGDLAFWRDRLEGSSRHGLFLLLAQGPSKFALDVLAFVKREERRLTGRRRHHRRQLTATEKIEERVTVLRGLQSKLAAALSKVNDGAGQLHLKPTGKGSSVSLGAAGLLTTAQRSIRASLAATAEAFEQLDPVKHKLRSHPEVLALPAPLSRASGAAGSRQGATAGFAAAAADADQPSSGASGGGNGAAGDAAAGSSRGGGGGGGPEAQKSTGDDGFTATLARARHAVGGDAWNLKVSPDMTITEAFQHANKAAHKLGPVVDLPPSIRAPSRYEQYWIRYALAGAVASYAAIFVYRHTRLSGSRDMERWASQAATGLRSTYRENVLGPLAQLRDELFKTFRQRRSIVSVAEYETDRESLRRMLADFQDDYLAKHKGRSPANRDATATTAAAVTSNSNSSASSGDAAGAAASAAPVGGENVAAAQAAGAGDEMMPGMAFMMDAYEQELKKPIRNVVNGQLPRTLLIQVQKLKLDTESAMLEMDQLLKANELNLALIAAIPAFLAAGGAVFLLYRWLKPAPVDAKYEALPCRMAMVELERALQIADADGCASAIGLVVYDTAKLYRQAWELYEQHSGSASSAEWPNLRRDLTDLAAPASLRQKLRITKRMSRVYTVFGS